MPVFRISIPMKKAFTLIELLVVIAIIAILAAILFPVFARAKEAAKKTQAIAQMRQLAAAVMMYGGDYDDMMPPASGREPAPTTNDPVIWTEIVMPYIKNLDILVAPASEGVPATSWGTRRQQTIGYSDATGVDPNTLSVPGAATPGTEGFPYAAGFSTVEEPVRVGLFTTTPGAPKGNNSTKHRGYVFNPYNGLNDPDGDYFKGLPMVSDRDLVAQTGDENYPSSPSLAAGALKPVFCRYQKDGSNNGVTPVVFADGHTKTFTARHLNSFGTVIWRFR